MKLIGNYFLSSILVFSLVFGSANTAHAGKLTPEGLARWTAFITAMMVREQLRALFPRPASPAPAAAAAAPLGDTPPSTYSRRGDVSGRTGLYMSPGSSGAAADAPAAAAAAAPAGPGIHLDLVPDADDRESDDDESSAAAAAPPATPASPSTHNIYVITPASGPHPFIDLQGVFQTEEQIAEILAHFTGAIILTDHRYVGRTTRTMLARFYEHARGPQEPGQRRLYLAMRRGIDNGRRFFMRRFLANVHPEQLNQFETLFMKLYDATGELGDNSTSGSGSSGDDRNHKKHGRDGNGDGSDRNGDRRGGGGTGGCGAASCPGGGTARELAY